MILSMGDPADATARVALALAREAVERYVRTGLLANPPPEIPPALREASGVFVTLRLGGELRGCIGTLAPNHPDAAREIIASALAAATGDPRFPPVGPGDLAALAYEVAIVCALEAVEAADLDPRVYGVVVEADGRRGVLLPDLPGVDTVEHQLAIAHRKAGLPGDQAVTLHRFRVRRYVEPVPHRGQDPAGK